MSKAYRTHLSHLRTNPIYERAPGRELVHNLQTYSKLMATVDSWTILMASCTSVWWVVGLGYETYDYYFFIYTFRAWPSWKLSHKRHATEVGPMPDFNRSSSLASVSCNCPQVRTFAPIFGSQGSALSAPSSLTLTYTPLLLNERAHFFLTLHLSVSVFSLPWSRL